jgi:hypothetical protein
LTKISPIKKTKKEKKKTGSSVIQTNKEAKGEACCKEAASALQLQQKHGNKHLFVTAFSQASRNAIASTSTESFVCCLYSKLCLWCFFLSCRYIG